MYMAGSKRPNQVSGGGIWVLKKEKNLFGLNWHSNMHSKLIGQKVVEKKKKSGITYDWVIYVCLYVLNKLS